MNTPICDFVKKYAESGMARLHMPGHKGRGMLGFESLDITEIEGADSLFEADGIIAESEKNASMIFGANTFYSAEGSSLCIRAMLCLIRLFAKSCGKKPLLLAGRNAHKTLIGAAALLDLDIDWIYPEAGESYLSCSITAERLEKILASYKELPTAVYITSPDYLGNMSDIKALSEVCHRYGILLSVDNAHGAYLKFLNPSRHPIDLGADICCDSAHKTLSALTGAAYLHISHNAPKLFGERAKEAMSLFASTSPSYLILQSLDSLNRSLCDGFSEKMLGVTAMLDRLKEHLSEKDFKIIGNEPMKLAISARSIGFEGNEIAEKLLEKGIVSEFHDRDYIVFMPSAETTAGELSVLENALLGIGRGSSAENEKTEFFISERIMSIREATLSLTEALPIEECLGRVLGAVSVGCPPAVPIVVSGERIDENAIKLFKYYGIKKCSVVI